MKSAPAESRVAQEFARRAARAESLAPGSPAAEEPLRFAAGLYRAQGETAAALEALHARHSLTGRIAEDAGAVLESATPVLRHAAEGGPDALSEEAGGRREEDREVARTRLVVWWAGDRPSTEDYLSRAILRPYVELLRTLAIAPERVHARGSCPVCGGKPWISARREGSLTEGARRMLGCALCGLEWPFERIRCASCFEEDPYKLPSFRDDKHPAIRIEACETCRRYVKSIDLSEDARPIPEVDDLASIAMDLWAAGQGWTRIEPGLAGI
ncbi:MAG TPA: formate dehydrogenase accessory protein FdhE [Thermoanaerobaculia bacterium]|nr:formate dehydrogenase accessory protein FdhE [Thermoanaerobaculia bacterium]